MAQGEKLVMLSKDAWGRGFEDLLNFLDLSSFPNLFYLAFRKEKCSEAVVSLQQLLAEEREDQKTLIQRREDNKSVPMPQE